VEIKLGENNALLRCVVDDSIVLSFLNAKKTLNFSLCQIREKH
jgi:hypothetical protein